jgi:colanic acid biosynthesis glycosyl transferase WcaI
VGLRLHAIELSTEFDRYSVAHRVQQELSYGAAFARLAASYHPDAILSSNDPLLAKSRAALWCWRSHTPWVFWLQDLYSVAMARYATDRLGRPGAVLGAAFKAVERRLLRQAGAVVMITEDFGPTLRSWRVPAERCHVIENWAPLDELAPTAKENPWARAHGLADAFVFLYSGTLGLKHDLEPLLALAEHHATDPTVRVVVVSEGIGADRLRQEQDRRQLGNILLLPFQPFERLSEVFGSADVLVGLLSSDAGAFSVPSKILSYLCAGRPVLAALPPTNLAARTIERAGAGIAVDAADPVAFLTGADVLFSDADLRRDMGRRARDYAERTFDIDAITSRFERILARVAGQVPRGSDVAALSRSSR